MRRAWRLSSDAAQAKELWLCCFHGMPANLGARSRLIHESASQNPSTSSSSQFTWSNISTLFFNKRSNEDSATKRDQRDRVSALKEELMECGSDVENIERVLEAKGVPLFRSYYDGSAVVELLKQLGPSPELAIQVFNWRREQMDCGAPMTTEEYARGISMAGRRQDIDLAEELFAEAANKKLKETSLYNALMGAYMYNGLAAKCQLLFWDLKHEATCRPTIVSYNILISVFGRLMLIDHMDAILREIKAENICPNLNTYNNLIDGYVTAWMWDSMEKTFMSLKVVGIEPDLATHLLMLRGYAHSGRLEKMEEIYELVKHHVNSEEIALIRAMICAYCRSSESNKVEKIEKLLMLVPENEYRPWLNVLLICLYANEDLLEAMENSISEAFEKNTAVRTNSIMRCIASSYFRQNAVDKFANFVKRAESAGWKICRSLYHCKMVMYSAERRLVDMEKVIDEMDHVNLFISKKTCWILYKAYTKWGEKSKLEQLKGIMCKNGYGIPTSL